MDARESSGGAPPLRELGARWLKAVENRLALLGLETQEQKIQTLQLLLLAAGLMCLAAISALAIVGIVLLVLPPAGRIAFLAVLAVCGAAGAFWMYGAIQARIRRLQPLESTLGAIREDMKCLGTKS